MFLKLINPTEWNLQVKKIDVQNEENLVVKAGEWELHYEEFIEGKEEMINRAVDNTLPLLKTFFPDAKCQVLSHSDEVVKGKISFSMRGLETQILNFIASEFMCMSDVGKMSLGEIIVRMSMMYK